MHFVYFSCSAGGLKRLLSCIFSLIITSNSSNIEQQLSEDNAAYRGSMALIPLRFKKIKQRFLKIMSKFKVTSSKDLMLNAIPGHEEFICVKYQSINPLGSKGIAKVKVFESGPKPMVKVTSLRTK